MSSIMRFFRAAIIINTIAFSLTSLMLILLAKNLTAAQTIEKTKKVRVGAYENHPKIFTDGEGNVDGIFPDILTYIADQEDWEIVYVHGSWTECLERLEEGEIDLMVDVAYSEDREVIYDFTDESVLINWGIIYSSNEQDINSIPDLRDKKIAIMKESIHTTGEGGIKNILDEFDIPVSYIEVENYTEVLELLDSKEADAGVVNRIFGATFEQDYKIKETPIIINPRELKFAMPKDSENNTYLTERIDKNLLDLKKDSNSIYYKTIDQYLAPVREQSVSSQIPKWILFSLLFVMLIAAFLLITNALLKKRVDQKTNELSIINKELKKEIKKRRKSQKELLKSKNLLKEKVKDLEKMNRLMVGREERIAELKKMVEE